MSESTSTPSELPTVVGCVSALGVSPADPKDWKDLRLGYRLHVVQSCPNPYQEDGVSTPLASLARGITQNRQAAFKTAKERGEDWSQVDEEEGWYRHFPQAVARLSQELGITILVQPEDEMRRESRTCLSDYFTNLQDEPRRTMGSAQRDGAWSTERMIVDIAKPDKSGTTPNTSQDANFILRRMRLSAPFWQYELGVRPGPRSSDGPHLVSWQDWLVTCGYDPTERPTTVEEGMVYVLEAMSST